MIRLMNTQQLHSTLSEITSSNADSENACVLLLAGGRLLECMSMDASSDWIYLAVVMIPVASMISTEQKLSWFSHAASLMS